MSAGQKAGAAGHACGSRDMAEPHTSKIVETNDGELVCACCGMVVEERPATGHIEHKFATVDGWSGYGMPVTGSFDPGKVYGVSRLHVRDSNTSKIMQAAGDIIEVGRLCPPDSCSQRIRDDVLDMMRRLRIARHAANKKVTMREPAILALLYLARENRNMPISYKELFAGVRRSHAHNARRLVRELRLKFFPKQSTLPSETAGKYVWRCGVGLPKTVLEGAEDLVPSVVNACPGIKAGIIAGACVLISLVGGLVEFRRKATGMNQSEFVADTPDGLAEKFDTTLFTLYKTAMKVAGITELSLVCSVCGVEVKRRHYGQKFCSKKCSRENKRRQSRLQNIRRREKRQAAGRSLDVEVNCSICGAGFKRHYGRQKTCSAKCSLENKRRWHQQKYGKTARACAVCGVEFQRANGTQKTCSVKCSVKHTRRWLQQQSGKAMRPCAVCGVEFKVIHGREKTCSSKCSLENKHRLNRTRYMQVREKKHPEQSALMDSEATCSICGTGFKRYHGRQKTCSRECSRKNNLLLTDKRRQRLREERRATGGPFGMDALCSVCGVGFKKRHGNKKTCSKECSLENKHRLNRTRYMQVREKKHPEQSALMDSEATCSICGAGFKRHRGHQKTCSKECAHKNQLLLNRKWRQRLREERQAASGAANANLRCSICGAEFRRVNGTQKTCSTKCSLENTRRLRQQRHIKTTRACAACGSEFKAAHGNRKMCSSECSLENTRRLRQQRHIKTTHACSICGAEFSVVSGVQKTCSVECSLAHRRRWHQQKYGKPARACAVCGVEFRRVNGTQKTCSAKCSLKNMHRWHQQKYGKPARACAVCGVEFRRINGTQKTCSTKCSLENKHRRLQQQSDKTMHPCVVCGAEFEIAHSKQKTCSAKCSFENRRSKQVAKTMRTCAACGMKFRAVAAKQKMCVECLLTNRRRRLQQQSGKIQHMCEVCGVEFRRVNGRQKTCSAKCSLENKRRRHQQKYGRTARACAICGAEFQRANGMQKTCSAKCSLENKHRRLQQKYGKPARACAICGAKFRRVNGTQKTCSVKCSLENKRRWHQQKYGKTARACAICGAVFKRVNGTQKTCSVKCSVENTRCRLQQQSGKAMRPCAVCGVEFRVIHGREKTCSSKCSLENRRRKQPGKKTSTCAVCGTGFRRTGMRQKTCSRECSRKNNLLLTDKRRLQVREERQAAGRSLDIEANCSICGAGFKRHHGRQKMCSKECAYKNQLLLNNKRRQQLREERQAAGRSPDIEMNCLICGAGFKRCHNSQKMCSKECAYKNQLLLNNKRRQQLREERQAAGRSPDIEMNCLICGAGFKRRYNRQKMCSKGCAYKNKLLLNNKRWQQLREERQAAGSALGIDLKCSICGAGFKRINTRQKTCSKDCAHKNRLLLNHKRRMRLREERQAAGGPFGMDASCSVCGIGFKKRHGGLKTCSKECALENKHRLNRTRYMQVREKKHPGQSAVVDSEATCSVCGSGFKRNRSNQKICSKKCSYKNQRRQRWKHKMQMRKKRRAAGRSQASDIKCLICGADFKRSSGCQKACSKECSHENNRRMARLRRIRERRKTRAAGRSLDIEMNCLICGAGFKRCHNSQKMCSKECAYKNQLLLNNKRRQQLREERQAAGRSLDIEMNCLICGAGFKRRYNRQKMCSKGCSLKNKHRPNHV